MLGLLREGERAQHGRAAPRGPDRPVTLGWAVPSAQLRSHSPSSASWPGSGCTVGEGREGGGNGLQSHTVTALTPDRNEPDCTAHANQALQ